MMNAFLIEANQPNVPKIWLKIGHRTEGKITVLMPAFTWTPDAANALKFVDQQSAEMMAELVSNQNPEWSLTVTGHTFDDGPKDEATELFLLRQVAGILIQKRSVEGILSKGEALSGDLRRELGEMHHEITIKLESAINAVLAFTQES
jgi:hypothetical protein